MIVPERCHGDDGVPERLWDAFESGVGDVILDVEHYCAEDDDSHRQREQQKAQFARTCLECVAEDAKTV